MSRVSSLPISSLAGFDASAIRSGTIDRQGNSRAAYGDHRGSHADAPRPRGCREDRRERATQRASRDFCGITMNEARPGAPGSIQRRRTRVSLSLLGVNCRRGQLCPSVRRMSLSVDLNGWSDMSMLRGNGGPCLTSSSSSLQGS